MDEILRMNTIIDEDSLKTIPGNNPEEPILDVRVDRREIPSEELEGMLNREITRLPIIEYYERLPFDYRNIEYYMNMKTKNWRTERTRIYQTACGRQFVDKDEAMRHKEGCYYRQCMKENIRYYSIDVPKYIPYRAPSSLKEL